MEPDWGRQILGLFEAAGLPQGCSCQGRRCDRAHILCCSLGLRPIERARNALTLHFGGKAMSNFASANRKFETWLRNKCDVVDADLKYKYNERMTESSFAFLRATYFRWADQVTVQCHDLNSAPSVLCVGDLHTENFGTWRDDDGRLVWGVNDFDEADIMPYAYDLVRLATSAALALPASRKEAAAAILAGYRQGLDV